MITITTNNPYPNIPVPAGADEVFGWADPGAPLAFRYFESAWHGVTRPW